MRQSNLGVESVDNIRNGNALIIAILEDMDDLLPKNMREWWHTEVDFSESTKIWEGPSSSEGAV